MKACRKNVFLLPAFIVGLGLVQAGRVTAQIYTILHSFTDSSDGSFPEAGLILSGNTLYGTAMDGGTYGNGTVFKVNTDGTEFMVLHSFSATSCYNCSNSDGARPYAGVILSGSTLYGTAAGGGLYSKGTVFVVNTDGTGFKTVHGFTGGSDGAVPVAGLIVSGTSLYGTAQEGGSSGRGTVFKVNTDGTGFLTLHSFTSTSSIPGFNTDGGYPEAGLILSGNTLYGAAWVGGSSANGTIFTINTNGSGFRVLHHFTPTPAYPSLPINGDGSEPSGSLILADNTLYGTATRGGSAGRGTVFKVNTDGTGFTTLHSFTATTPSPGPRINSDGAYPQAGLVLSGNTLYGTAHGGGSSGTGTVFAVNTDGTGFTNLHNFTAATGEYPWGELILSGNTLYGTTSVGGGTSDDGTVFSLLLPLPELTIVRSGANVILTWPASAAGWTLQSTADLFPPAAWSPVSPEPVVINGLNSVTTSISGSRKFYRLSQ